MLQLHVLEVQATGFETKAAIIIVDDRMCKKTIIHFWLEM